MVLPSSADDGVRRTTLRHYVDTPVAKPSDIVTKMPLLTKEIRHTCQWSVIATHYHYHK